jgi:hypothetical protein
MKTVIDPKTHESVLAKWRGAQAKIWLFHVSLSRMVLNLSRKDEQEALYLVAVGCERISGPFHWEPAEVSILTEPPNQRGEVYRRILDKQAGFELLCSDVVIARGAKSVPSDPFSGFLGEK